MDTTITGLNGNNVRNANFTVNILDAEIVDKKEYLGTLILNQAWIGVASTLLLTVTTTDEAGTENPTSSTYAALADQPLRDFMNAAMVQYQAEIVDANVSFTMSGANMYTVNINAEDVNGAAASDLKIRTVTCDVATLTYVAIT